MAARARSHERLLLHISLSCLSALLLRRAWRLEASRALNAPIVRRDILELEACMMALDRACDLLRGIEHLRRVGGALDRKMRPYIVLIAD